MDTVAATERTVEGSQLLHTVTLNTVGIYGYAGEFSGDVPKISNYNLKLSNYNFRTSNYNLQPSRYTFKASNYNLQPSNYNFRTSNYILKASGYTPKPSTSVCETGGYSLKSAILRRCDGAIRSNDDRVGVSSSLYALTSLYPTLRHCMLSGSSSLRSKGIPLGMPRSVENRYCPVLHPVRDASLTGCNISSPVILPSDASLTGCATLRRCDGAARSNPESRGFPDCFVAALPAITTRRFIDRKLKHTVNKVSSLRDLSYSPVMLIINPESGSWTEISGSDNNRFL
ncbi:MAG: hypothetical protein LBQ01_04350 [Prevotellaceae bacterium]|jgi:hypothetical protein|nr:hypothetical protein [Prevotellaceae bacterium]